MLKVSENPPVTWPQDTRLEEFVGRWWVAHTRSRNEKALAHDLIARNVSYFLPMSWRTRRIRGRKMKSLLPLFGGYLFFCGEENQRLEVLKTNRVANLIEVTDQTKMLSELTEIEKAISAGVSLQPHKYIERGTRCRVTTGPLRDLEGVVLTTKAATRLILQIDMLGQAASVEVDTDTIEKID